MDMFNLYVRKLANRIGISEGYATVLLLSNDWDEASTVEEWNQADNDLATRSGIVVYAEYLTTEGFCDSCETHTTCKTYGCSHLLCRICVKDYVEQNIRSGSLNVKCLISECNKNMSCSRFLDDVSLDCKNSFNAALAENYTLSKSKNAVQNPIASLKGLVAYLRANKWNFVSRAATFLQSNMWTLLASLLFAILVCQQFCGGITFTCVGVYSALCLVARYVCWGHMMKLIFAFFFYKLVTTNSVFTAAAFSSAATLVLIFAAIVGLVRRCFQIVMRIFRYISSAYVSSVFRVAGNSDFAWEKFIPSVYGRLISSLTHLSFSSKKEIYRCLCESILIDNGRKVLPSSHSTIILVFWFFSLFI